MSYLDTKAVKMVAEGAVLMAESQGEDVKGIREMITSIFESQAIRQETLSKQAGVNANCRIFNVSVTCASPTPGGEPGFAHAAPIDWGPKPRHPIGWGGSECFQFLNCTICYEYECRPEEVVFR